MGYKTKIEWTESTWNPISGCDKISEGCRYCYAERIAKRFDGNFKVKFHPDRLTQPTGWRKPRRIFVCSMGDLFHEAVSFDFIAKVIYQIEIAHWHTFFILTKRPRRMLTFFDNYDIPSNLWLGVSIENEEYFWRSRWLCALKMIKPFNAFISYEPLLGPMKDILAILIAHEINWVIVGCESGPKARPMDLNWVREIRDACIAARIPFFFKQAREPNGKIVHLPELDDKVYAEVP